MPEPFLSYSDAVKAGIPRRRLQSSAFTRVMRDCYLPAEITLTHELLVRAALATVPGADFAFGHSAAALWGAVAPATTVAHIGGADARRSIRGQVRFRQYRKMPELASVRGIRLTSPARTFLDMAECLEFVDLLILGDSLIHKTGLTAPDLRTAAAAFKGRNGRLAREVASMCRDRVESPGESRTRLLIVAAGLPEPVTNHAITDESGKVVRRIDLAYPEWKIAIEYDGRHHIERKHQWTADIGRREELEGIGWRFVVVTSSDLFPDPDPLLGRVADAIAGRSGTRPPIGDGWRRYFSQRT